MYILHEYIINDNYMELYSILTLIPMLPLTKFF